MFPVWSLPESVASGRLEIAAGVEERIKHYRFVQKHFLKDGTRIIPTVETTQNILDSYDMFGLPVAIEEGSYTVFKN